MQMLDLPMTVTRHRDDDAPVGYAYFLYIHNVPWPVEGRDGRLGSQMPLGLGDRHR